MTKKGWVKNRISVFTVKQFDKKKRRLCSKRTETEGCVLNEPDE